MFLVLFTDFRCLGLVSVPFAVAISNPSRLSVWSMLLVTGAMKTVDSRLLVWI
jgi:hypothetical protein